MSPFELDILIWYYAHTIDHDVVRDCPPIWPETRNYFIREKLLETPGTRWGCTYQIGERGKVFLDHILNLPLPSSTWRMP